MLTSLLIYLLLLQPLKPKLSRKVVKGSKINLNQYWNKFQETVTFPVLLQPEVDNEINDNLSNEWKESKLSK